MRRVSIAFTAAALSIVLVAAMPIAGAATAITELVSLNTNGTQGNDISGRFAGPAISGDGQVVAFDSVATTLVSGDTNVVADVFVHERATYVTERVSVTSAGGPPSERHEHSARTRRRRQPRRSRLARPRTSSRVTRTSSSTCSSTTGPRGRPSVSA